MTDDETDLAAHRAQEIVDAISNLLSGHPPEMQGAIIADLLAKWLAGHAPQLRADVLASFLELVRNLTDVEELMMFGPKGHPGREG
jgi:hypothetical protein